MAHREYSRQCVLHNRACCVTGPVKPVQRTPRCSVGHARPAAGRACPQSWQGPHPADYCRGLPLDRPGCAECHRAARGDTAQTPRQDQEQGGWRHRNRVRVRGARRRGERSAGRGATRGGCAEPPQDLPRRSVIDPVRHREERFSAVDLDRDRADHVRLSGAVRGTRPAGQAEGIPQSAGSRVPAAQHEEAVAAEHQGPVEGRPLPRLHGAAPRGGHHGQDQPFPS